MANSANIIFGIDTDVSCASDASWLASNAGACFVGRYYSGADASKVLTQSEAQALSAAGLQIFTVYEDEAQSASDFSAALGQQNANTAVEQAIAVGQPAGSAIYFAVDYDAPSADIEGCIASYFSAVAAVLAEKGYAVGVYGSGAVCAAMRAGCASYAWLSQSGAYTGTPTFADWAIRQYCTTSLWVTSDPSDQLSVDLDCARANFGGFTVPAS